VAITHLADTSALAELHQATVAARIGPLLVGGQVATCAIVDLEVLANVDGPDRAEVLIERRSFPRVPCGDDALDRAIQVQGLLGDPSPPPVALVVAAAAELAGLVLLHNDETFVRIASVTEQAIERVV